MAIQYTITQNPEFALVTVQLEAGQKIYSEPGAMASMDDNIKLTDYEIGNLVLYDYTVSSPEARVRRTLKKKAEIKTYF